MILEATQTAAETLIGQYGIGGAAVGVLWWLGKQFLKQNERMLNAFDRMLEEMVNARHSMDAATTAMRDVSTSVTSKISKSA